MAARPHRTAPHRTPPHHTPPTPTIPWHPTASHRAAPHHHTAPHHHQVTEIVKTFAQGGNTLSPAQFYSMIKTFDWANEQFISSMAENAYEVTFEKEVLGFTVKNTEGTGTITGAPPPRQRTMDTVALPPSLPPCPPLPPCRPAAPPPHDPTPRYDYSQPHRRRGERGEDLAR